MNTDNPTHWIDYMPALPLAEDLPIRDKQNPTRSGVVLERSGDNWKVFRHDTKAVGIVGHAWSESQWVIDLDSPAGFAVAVREAGALGSGDAFLTVNAWSREEITEEDRLALASKLAELV